MPSLVEIACIPEIGNLDEVAAVQCLMAMVVAVVKWPPAVLYSDTIATGVNGAAGCK